MLFPVVIIIVLGGIKCEPSDDNSQHVAAAIGLLAARNHLGPGGGDDPDQPRAGPSGLQVPETTTVRSDDEDDYMVPPEMLSFYVPGYRSREPGWSSGSDAGSWCSIQEYFSRGGELYPGSDAGSEVHYPNGPSPSWWFRHDTKCHKRRRKTHARLPGEKACVPCGPASGGASGGRNGSSSSPSSSSAGSSVQEWNYGYSSSESVYSASSTDSLGSACCHDHPHDEFGRHISEDEYDGDEPAANGANGCVNDEVVDLTGEEVVDLTGDEVIDLTNSSDDDDIVEVSRSGPCARNGAIPRRRPRSPRSRYKKPKPNMVEVCCRDGAPSSKKSSEGSSKESLDICCSMRIRGRWSKTRASNIVRSSMIKTLNSGVASPVPFNREIFGKPGQTVAFGERASASGIPATIILGVPTDSGSRFRTEVCFRRSLSDAETASVGPKSPVPTVRDVHDFCTLMAEGDDSVELYCTFPSSLPFVSRKYKYISVICVDPVEGVGLEKVHLTNSSNTGFYCAPLRQQTVSSKRVRRVAWPFIALGVVWVVSMIGLAASGPGNAAPKIVLGRNDGFRCPENFILVKLDLTKYDD